MLSKRKTPLPSGVCIRSIDFLMFCFEKATQMQEYAREVANPAGVRKFGESLIYLAVTDSLDTTVSQARPYMLPASSVGFSYSCAYMQFIRSAT